MNSNIKIISFLFICLIYSFPSPTKAQLSIDTIVGLTFGETPDPVPAVTKNYDWLINGFRGLYWAYKESETNADRYFLIDLQDSIPRIASSSAFLSFVNPETGSFSNLVARKFLYPNMSDSGVGYSSTSSLSGALETLSLISPQISLQTTDGVTNNVQNAGFSADDIEAILPQAVYTDSSGNKFVDYMQILPYLVAAVKELQGKVITQQDAINQLKPSTSFYSRASLSSYNTLSGINETTQIERASLNQNAPNPAKSKTNISGKIPESAQKAFILIHDMQGRTIAQYPFLKKDHLN